METTFVTLKSGNNGRFAPDPEGGRGAVGRDIPAKRQSRISLKRMNTSRPPWGAGSGANRIAKRFGAGTAMIDSGK